MSKLTKTQERFCNEFIIDLNATQAGIRTGYAKRSVRQITSRLMTKDNIQQRIRELMEKREQRLKVDADAVVTELTRIAFSDIGEFIEITKDGTVIPKQLDELGSSRTRLIQEIQSDPKSGIKLKLHDKMNALINLGKHLGLFEERVRVMDAVEVRPELNQFNKAELRQLREIMQKVNKRRST